MRSTPQRLGLPEKFHTFRPKQEEALDWLSQCSKRVRAICAPTGSGKSILGVADSLRCNKVPTAYVTDSRALQDQVMENFEEIGAVDLRGRANYDCQLKPDDTTYTCEHGYHARCPYKGTVHCPASQAEMRAAASWLVVTNYDKWIHARKFSQGLTHIKRVIFDEGDQGPNALARAMQINLHTKEIEETLGVPFPSQSEAQFFSTWKPWAAEARVKCETLVLQARAKLMDPNVKAVWVKHFTHLRNLSRKLGILAAAAPNNWIVEEFANGRGYQFDPINPARYSESALLLRVPEIIVMSATLREKTLWMMGIGRADYDFKEFLSDFDPRRCPIYYVPTMRVDSRAGNLDSLWVRLDQVAAARRDRNGLIHTVSYTRRDAVLAASRFSTSMFVNERGDPPTEMIEIFKSSYPGAILVSPSIGRGHDFAGKAAEWQFICKIPFPPPSRILEARKELDKEYPYYLAMQTLVQNCGRIMRYHEDQGETFIGDDHLQWFLPRYGHLAPKSFGQFFTPVRVLPQPPRRLD
jgi:Rad3-related DNA helicase